MQMTLFPRSDLFEAAPTILAGVIFIGMGLLFLFLGWHTYRVTLAAVGVLVGAGLGASLAALVDLHPLYFVLPLGILFGFLAVALEKAGAIFVGGLFGALPIVALRGEFQVEWAYYAALIAGFLVGAILAIYLWKPVVVFFLSVIGAAFMMNGAALVIERLSPGSGQSFMKNHPAIMLCAFIALALFGAYSQVGIKAKEEGAAE